MLFALRETPQGSPGISPFKLLFGRKVEGPLQVVKEKWLNPSPGPIVTVATYLQNHKDNLAKVRQFAKENFLHAQTKMKIEYDKRAKVRNFIEGDKVLVYFPISGSPKAAKYHGPFDIKQKVDHVNYIIQTPGHRKKTQLVQINLLKPYKTRETADDSPQRPPCNITNTKADQPVVYVWINASNEEILIDLPYYLDHLDVMERQESINILNQYPSVFCNIPGQYSVIKHDVELLPGTHPIRLAPYRLN